MTVHRLQFDLDTSVINHLFHKDVPERQAATIRFLEKTVRPGLCKVFVSYVVLDEIALTPEPARRDLLLTALAEFSPGVYHKSDGEEEVRHLVEFYHEKKILPPREFSTLCMSPSPRCMRWTRS